MSAEVIQFPAKTPEPPKHLKEGDLLVTCFNATVGLWCAWPVAAVDDDGAPMGVRLKNGRVMAVERVSCSREVYGFRRACHDADEPEMAYCIWPSAEAALAAIGVAASDRPDGPEGGAA